MNRITTGGTTKTERVCAWIAAFMLAVFLSVTILGTAAVQMITSAGLHLNVAADAGCDGGRIRIFSGKCESYGDPRRAEGDEPEVS